ncbi:MAG: hypothetical protein EBS97_00500 [Verrucomicrobia bacterium]|nr:hypothetical protein [Verrucomicrobiota bacterium]NBT23385.1 hypothetical protein [bacterium]
MNSKASRAASSAQSKQYFARKKQWQSSNSTHSAFLPSKTKPKILQATGNKTQSRTNNSDDSKLDETHSR